MAHLNVSAVARQLGAKPQHISELFYRRILRDDLCPVASGRRLISPDYVETIRAALSRAGKPVSGLDVRR
jgi:hypothetical protein